MSSPFLVRPVTWQSAGHALSAVRRAVFIEEQGVPQELEWDEHDREAQHVLASTPEGVPIGTGRLLRDGRIGRMAVVKAWRRRGVGGALLEALIAMAKESGCRAIWLHAQVHALAFYEHHGFEATGPEFVEAGILHREMVISARPQGAGQ